MHSAEMWPGVPQLKHRRLFPELRDPPLGNRCVLLPSVTALGFLEQLRAMWPISPQILQSLISGCFGAGQFRARCPISPQFRQILVSIARTASILSVHPVLLLNPKTGRYIPTTYGCSRRWFSTRLEMVLEAESSYGPFLVPRRSLLSLIWSGSLSHCMDKQLLSLENLILGLQ